MQRSLLLAAAGLVALGAPPRPDDPVASIEIDPRFEVELVAREPVVFDPVDLEFDERGRVFVLEMPGYPLSEDAGRVVLLGDEDGDGRFERRTVFADGLAGTADSILPWRGGLLVASPPAILFLEDDDGDGRAERRRVVLDGFATGNPQHNVNGLTHGLDNWIYGVNGGSSGAVFWPDDPDTVVDLHDEDFRVDLDRRRFERTGQSAGGFGFTLDEWGRSFSTHNTEHISHLVFPGRFVGGQPASRRETRDYISDHEENGPARLYPIGVQQTRVNHPEQAGHFSGACGITAYTGGAFGDGFDSSVFVADVVLNLVHRDVVREAGASLAASRDRPRAEFLASSDRAFRPVNMTVGPDGALYLLDMHRDVIEHPEWIPDEIEATLDLDAGKDEGRIFRITPRGGLPRVRGRLDRDDPVALVAALGHPNRWWRDTAQRLLVEAGATVAAPALREALLSSGDPRRRLHALWTLEGLGQLRDAELTRVLEDAHPRVRESALVVAEERFGDRTSLLAAVLDRAADPDPRVRMQAALAIGRAGDERGTAALLDLAARDGEDRWTGLAVLAGLARDPRAALRGLLARPALAASPGGQDLARGLAATVPPTEAGAILTLLEQRPGAPDSFVRAALLGLADGLEGAGPGERTGATAAAQAWLHELGASAPPPLARAAGRVGRGLGLEPTPPELERWRRAGEEALDPAKPADERLDALALFELLPFPARRDTLFALLDTRHPASLQLAAFGQLRDGDDSVAPRLLQTWRDLGLEVRAEAGTFLLRRRANHGPLLDAIEEGTVTLGELNLDLERRRALLRSPDEEVRERAGRLFSDKGVVTRAEALAAMRPALDLEGSPERGHAVFTRLCVRCHRVGGEGTDLGPDLTEISRKSAETLLHEIVDPNAAVEARFVGYTVETRDGRILSGILVGESDDRLSVREAGGRDTEVERRDIERLYTDGLSAMPEQLETGMDPREMADLLAFLQVRR